MNQLLYVQYESLYVPPERQRKDFNPKTLTTLAESIKRLGFIQPIVVEPENGRYRIVAGERRWRAAGQLLKENTEHAFSDQCPAGHLPVLPRSELDDLTRFELELEENIQREDLTWQEKALALAKYHKLKNGNQPQPIAVTATEARVAPSTVTSSLIVAEQLERNPKAFEKAKTLDEAAKIVRKQNEARHLKELAKTFDLTKTEHKLIHSETIAALQQMESGTFDVICTDPPYGIDADGFGDQAGTGHNYKDDPETVKKLLTDFAEESYRVAKKDSFAYIFCSIEWFDWLKDIMGLAGWNVWARPLIWNKMNAGMLPVPDKGPRYTYECILYAHKGERKVVRQAMPDVLSYPPVKKLLHGAQKPAPLLVDLLSRVALPGDKVLDGFAGSGSIFLACNTLRLTATAVEGDEETYNLALSRIALKADVEPADLAPEIVI